MKTREYFEIINDDKSAILYLIKENVIQKVKKIQKM